MRKTLLTGVSIVMVVMMAGLCSAAPKIEGKPVEYTAGNVTMKGYLAYDESITGRRPGVLVVHEWWGHNEYARKRARMLAELGYTALAVDMYGGGKQADHPEDAMKFSSEVMKNFPEAQARFEAAMKFLRNRPSVDPKQIAAVGYCFGGGVVLNMARQGLDLKGAVSLHGSLAAVKLAKKGTVKAKIRVYNGADDKFTSQEAIDAFMDEMMSAKVDFQFISYSGALHAFTNPDATEVGKKFGIPIAYNADADRKSWEDMTKFLEKIFKK